MCDITCRDVIEDVFLEAWSVSSTGPGFLDDCVFTGVGQTDARTRARRLVIFEITTQLHFVIIAKGRCLMLALDTLCCLGMYSWFDGTVGTL